jgi:hypothetical protein
MEKKKITKQLSADGTAHGLSDKMARKVQYRLQGYDQLPTMHTVHAHLQYNANRQTGVALDFKFITPAFVFVSLGWIENCVFTPHIHPRSVTACVRN